MIEVETLHHVAVCVTDIDRAKHFYGVVLGLPEVARPPFDFGGAWYRFGDRQLHLIVHPPTLTMRRTREIDARDGHLALRVRSYRQAIEHLRAHGVECLERPRNLTPWPQAYVTDPDGNVVELNAERLDEEAGGNDEKGSDPFACFHVAFPETEKETAHEDPAFWPCRYRRCRGGRARRGHWRGAVVSNQWSQGRIDAAHAVGTS